MRRVVSLFLPMWPTDRYRKNTGDAPPREKPLVMATKIGPRRVIVAADKAAQALGLRAGLTVAHAQALVPELHVAESIPEKDEEGLTRLATGACATARLWRPTARMAFGSRSPGRPTDGVKHFHDKLVHDLRCLSEHLGHTKPFYQLGLRIS